jgi:hypothetical protein
MENQKFFCVWNYGRGLPRVRHATKKEAQAEAGRLAGMYPGERFYVMSAFAYCSTEPVVNLVALPDRAPQPHMCDQIETPF